MKTLDSSHKQVLIHWNTLEQMKRCANEAQEYLIEVAQHSFKTLGAKVTERLQMGDAIRKEQYFDFFPAQAAQREGPADVLFTIGVENISIQHILYPTPDEYCRAYFYSPYRADNVNTKGRTDLVATAVPPPKGFTIALDFPRRGYFFQAQLSSITVDDFSDAPKLSQYFSSAVSPIVEWYLENEAVLLKAAS
jgi:hypothetical protein